MGQLQRDIKTILEKLDNQQTILDGLSDQQFSQSGGNYNMRDLSPNFPKIADHFLTFCREVNQLSFYKVDQKFGTCFVRLITSSNVDQFSNFFTVRITRTIINRSNDTSNVSLHYLVKGRCLKSNN